MELKTPLYECHQALKGKMVPFAGYLLPVQYTGVIQEHMAVRTAAGLFDVSHMGELLLTGPDALANLNHLFTNDFTTLADGKVRYTPICNEAGGVVDDVLVYRFDAEKYWVVVNAANRHKDVDFIRAHLSGEAVLEDISDSLAQLALQGPRAGDILARLAKAEDIPEKYYSFKDGVEVAGIQCLVSQTGYTGERGYELYCPAADGPGLWNALLKAGAGDGLMPCGLGARDTLRLEAAMPLYGHEMDDSVSPLETGLGFAVKMAKEDFVGKAGLEKRGQPTIARVGLKMIGRGIARENCPVFQGQQQVGHTTSGTHLPTLAGAYAMALVSIEAAAPGTQLSVDVRGRPVIAEVVELPFYKRP